MNPLGEELPAAGEIPAVFLNPLGALERRWKTMLAVFLLGAMASVAVWFLVEPRYRADATVMVARQQVSERLVEPTIQEDALTRVEALAAEVLSSRNVAKLVEEFGLYPELREVETMAEIVDRVRADVSIAAVQTVGKASGDVSARAYLIGFEATDPKAAAGVANGLATLFVDTSLAERHRQHELTTEFLRRELSNAEEELRKQNRAISEFKQKNRGLLPSDLQANLARLDLLQSQRQSLALQIAEAGTRLATLASEDVSSPDARLGLLRDELVHLRATQTPRHPDLIDLEQRISDLEKQRAAEQPEAEAKSPRGLLQSADQTLGVLRQQLVEAESELRDLDARIGNMPAVQEQLTSLEEKALILRENYLEFLRKVHESELDESLLKAQQGERVSVLNPAEPPSRPIRPGWQYLAIGLLGSLGLALASGVMLDLLDPVVVSTDQINRVSALPVLGSVARIR